MEDVLSLSVECLLQVLDNLVGALVLGLSLLGLLYRFGLHLPRLKLL